MAKQVIEIGTPPAGQDGDTNREASIKCNANFTELYNAVALAVRGPASALGGEVAVFSGTTGKDIVGGGILGSAAFQSAAGFEKTLTPGTGIAIDRTVPAAPVISVLSAPKLTTARSINGVAFDGTADITIADSTKEPAIAAGASGQYWNGLKQWVDLSPVIRAVPMTGLSTATSAVVTAADTLIVAIGKLQRQVSDALANPGGTLTGALNENTPATLASAATVNIGAATANTVNITGAITITAFDSITAGAVRRLKFDSALVLTHNATSLILPGQANIATAANDVATMLSLGGGNWICVQYQRASGKPVAFAFDRANIVGTVSDSGGVPNGAILESGTISGCYYEKRADGSLLNRKQVTIGGGTAANGGVFKSVNFDMGPFAVAFVGDYEAFGYGISSASGGGWAGQQVFGTTATWGQWAAYTSSLVTGSMIIAVMAVGRWK